MANNLELVTNKKDIVLERINKRNKDRQNYLETKLELRNKENTELEGTDFFAQAFSDRAKEIEKNIINVELEKADLLKIFAGINNDIQELQRYLSNSTLFLPDYNVRACQNILNGLTLKSEEVRQRLMPKKKFGFQNKKAVATVRAIPNTEFDKIDFNEKDNISSSSFAWTLVNRQNEYILLNGNDVDKQDLTLSNLKNCLIEIKGHAGSLQISEADNCIFLCGPISRSLFAENCSNCKFAAACQQLRLHSSSNCKLWLHVTCRAIIEDCTKIEVDDYNFVYSGIDIDFKKSGLNRAVNNFKDIADFNWLSPEQPSPNWKLISDDNYKKPNWSELRKQFEENKKN